MAKSKKGFTIPRDQWKEFDLLVQRANRRIESNLKYIQKENIQSEAGRRALVSSYASPQTWASSKMVFSRSKHFESEKAYKQFVRHVSQWGENIDTGERTKSGKPKYTLSRSTEELREGYYKAIVNALTVAAIDNGQGGILNEDGSLPAGLADIIKGLTLEQMTHFFESGDPSEDLEYLPYSGEEYEGVNQEMFVNITISKLNALTRIYPYNPHKQAAIVRKSNKRKKGSKKRSKKKKK